MRVFNLCAIAFMVFFQMACGHPDNRSRAPGLIVLNGTLIDGTGEPPLENAAIVILDDRISAVGTEATIFRHPDDEVLDVEERFIIPAVINAHVHNAFHENNLIAWAQAGVTTVRDVGTTLAPPPQWNQLGIDNWDDWVTVILQGTSVADLIPPAFAQRDSELDHTENARILAAGPCVTATGGYPGGQLSLHVNMVAVEENGVEISPVEDARRKVAALVEAGADVIKICIENHWGTNDWGLLSQEQVAAIVEVAHQGGIPVTSHVSANEQLTKCVNADPPIDDAAHIVTDELSDANIARMVNLGISIVPTLAVWESMSEICNDFGKCDQLENLRRFVLAGGRVALGDDYGNPGIELGMPIRDMQLMQAAGLSNLEIIVAATRNGAAVCRRDDVLGTIEAGRLADLIVLNSNPLHNIDSMADVAYVFKSGVPIRTP